MGGQLSALTTEELELLEILRTLRKGLPHDLRGYGEVGFNTRAVEPMMPEYVTRDSILQISMIAYTANNTVTVAYKLLLPNGKINTSQETLSTGTARTASTVTRNLTEGFLLSMCVSVSNANQVCRGDTFLRIGLLYGQGGSPPFYRCLLQGYPTSQGALAWPDGPQSENVAGQGLCQLLAAPTFSAGADLTFNAYGKSRVRVRSIAATLVTSATVANRTPQFFLQTDGPFKIWQVAPSAAQTASTTKTYYVGQGVQNYTDTNGNVFLPLPSDVLFDTLALVPIIGSTTTNLQAGDQWGPVSCEVESWWEL